MLKVRILTASLLGAALFFSLFVLPTPWTVIVFAVVFTLAAWEWTGFGALRARASRIAYTAAMAVLLAAAWRWSADPPHLLMLLKAACVWWIVALLWLCVAPGMHQPALALFCGAPVLVPAFIALARVLVGAWLRSRSRDGAVDAALGVRGRYRRIFRGTQFGPA
jgi:CDP-diglyceride synthetase